MWTANVTDRRYVLYGGCRKGAGMCLKRPAGREGGIGGTPKGRQTLDYNGYKHTPPLLPALRLVRLVHPHRCTWVPVST